MKRTILNLSCAMAISALFLADAYATDLYWVCGNGSWDNGSCWSATSGGPGGAGQPQGPSDNANLVQSDSSNRTITLSNNASTGSLIIDSTGTGAITLSQSMNQMGAVNEIVGYSGTGTYN